jgi:hypothetical protein
MSKVELVQASRSNGVTIFTLVCEFPLTILNQLLTHRAFSRNSSSARAVPVGKACSQLIDDPAQPIWTSKSAGMSGDLINDPIKLETLNAIHKNFLGNAIGAAQTMDALGVHKQNAGRYLTPFQNCRVVLTATDWANWDWLRQDGAAQPEIRLLADQIFEARENAEIMDLEYEEYHVPFIRRHRAINGDLEYFVEDAEGYTRVCLEHAIKVSMSACAQTSYRKLDTSVEKAESIIPKLFDGDKVHASPSEHQAMAMNHDMVDVIAKGTSGVSLKEALEFLQDGATAINIDGTIQSGNFTNWIQHRQLLPNHDGGINEHSEPAKEEVVADISDLLNALGESLKGEVPTGKAPEPTKRSDPPTPEEFEKMSDEDQDKAMQTIQKEVLDILSNMKKSK